MLRNFYNVMLFRLWLKGNIVKTIDTIQKLVFPDTSVLFLKSSLLETPSITWNFIVEKGIEMYWKIEYIDARGILHYYIIMAKEIFHS